MANLPVADHRPPSLGRLTEIWVNWLAEKGEPGQRGTAQTYRNVWNEAQPVLHRVLQESGGILGPEQVRIYADLLANDPKHPKAPNTIALHLSTLSSFWTYLQRVGVVRENPWRLTHKRKLKDTTAERILSEEEIHKLIQAATGRDRLILRTLYLTGARVSEVAGLRWRDLRTEGNKHILTIYGKGGKTRWVTVPQHLYEEWVLFHGGHEPDGNTPIFPSTYHRENSRWNGNLSDRTIEWIVEQVAAKAGFAKKYWNEEKHIIETRWVKRPSPHWFRHSHATHALDHGAPIHWVKDTLGHASLATTGKYVHVAQGSSSADYLPDI